MTITPSSAAGIRAPDTGIAREADQLVRDTTSELIYHHSRRVFWFGALQGRRRDLSFDPELLYIGALFHDLGLGERFHGSGRRFEVDSADEARRFLRSHHVPEDSIRRVWTAIALHTTPGIPQFMEPEVALVTAGVEYDVLGIGYEDISEADRAEIVALHPRPDFKRRILASPEHLPLLPQPSPDSPFYLVTDHEPARGEKIIHGVSLPFRPPTGPLGRRRRAPGPPAGRGSSSAPGEKWSPAHRPCDAKRPYPIRGRASLAVCAGRSWPLITGYWFGRSCGTSPYRTLGRISGWPT